jgi:protein SCO1/2
MSDAPKPSQANALLVLFAFIALGAGLVSAVIRAPQTPSIPGLLWPDPPVLGSFSLQGADGNPLSETALKGRWTLLFFGFTHCPDVCPTTLAVLKQVAHQLAADEFFKSEGQVLFVSIDPARDTPATLANYVHYFNPAFLAATGPDAALNALTTPLSVIRAQIPNGKDDYAFDHTASIFLVAPDLRVLGKFGLPHDAGAISAGFRAITAFGREHP